ncbi:uncharacterized protein PFLUO_LOCUS3223 [Penicillium psychrofluorescens]|uniref:uncharacterized protein n=1 Tax=Penicillium psychrofluorescens TaxID=3158075 RepID=UPI003CCDAB60
MTVSNAELVPGVAALSDFVKKSTLSHTASHAAPQATSHATSNAAHITPEMKNQTEPTNHTADSSASVLSSNSKTCDSNNDVAIGAGVGVPLGLLAIAFLVWALWERRKGKKMQALAAHKNSESHDLMRELPASIPVRAELESVSGSCSRAGGSHHNGSYH